MNRLECTGEGMRRALIQRSIRTPKQKLKKKSAAYGSKVLNIYPQRIGGEGVEISEIRSASDILVKGIAFFIKSKSDSVAGVKIYGSKNFLLELD